MLMASIRPSKEWGPLNQSNLLAWRRYKESRRLKREKRDSTRLKQFLYVLLGWEEYLD